MKSAQQIALASAAALTATLASATLARAAESHGPADLRGRLEVSSNVALLSDYRARGISPSDRSPAIQGGFDIAERSGWGAGVWASSIEETGGATLELDLYVSRTLTFGATELSIGATAFVYPAGDHLNYGEALVSIARAVGPVDATLGANYAWAQDNLGDEDNLYVSLNAVTPIGRLAGVPVALGGGVGYEDGPFAIEGTKFDWSLSLTADVAGVAIGVSYVDTDIKDALGKPTGVFSVARSF